MLTIRSGIRATHLLEEAIRNAVYFVRLSNGRMKMRSKPAAQSAERHSPSRCSEHHGPALLARQHPRDEREEHRQRPLSEVDDARRPSRSAPAPKRDRPVDEPVRESVEEADPVELDAVHGDAKMTDSTTTSPARP